MISKTKEEILNLFKEKPYLLNMGAGSLSKRFGCEREVIYQCKKIYKKKEISKPLNFPKILILDIETAPIKAAVWRIWNINVNLNQIESDWFCLTWAAKWLYSNEVISDRLTSEEVLNEDDGRLMEGMWNLLNEADIIIAHNGNKFDIPKINTRLITNGFKPPSPYRQIDTLIEAKKIFSFTSNKLDFINKQLGITRKIDTGGAELWTRCVNGEDSALNKMEDYNRGDVEILEENYLILRPWMKSHPNIGMYMNSDIPVCSSCGSSNIQPTHKYHYTNTGKYSLYKCEECGADSRGRRTELDSIKRKVLLTSVPR